MKIKPVGVFALVSLIASIAGLFYNLRRIAQGHVTPMVVFAVLGLWLTTSFAVGLCFGLTRVRMT
jgi:hypothetical protein